MMEAKSWRHAFKLDPDKHISDDALEAISESGTDAIIVGGTYGVTFDNTIDLLSRVRRFAVPCALEISNRDALVPGFDHYFIPLVLNAMNPEWLIKPHLEVIKELGTLIPWKNVSTVGYCVLNGDSGVAQLTDSRTNLELEDVLAHARLAAHLLKLPYFYLEYSGQYGDPALVKQVYEALKKEGNIHVFYGGGISNEHQAQEMLSASDTIVVGNLIYEDLEAALRTVLKEEG